MSEKSHCKRCQADKIWQRGPGYYHAEELARHGLEFKVINKSSYINNLNIYSMYEYGFSFKISYEDIFVFFKSAQTDENYF